MSFLLVGKLVAQTQTPEQAPVTQLIAGFESPVDDLVGSPWKLESYGKGAVDLQFQETDQAIGKAASVHCDGSAGPKGLLMHGLSKPTDWTRFVEFSVNVMRQGTGEPNRLFLQFWSVNEQGKGGSYMLQTNGDNEGYFLEGFGSAPFYGLTIKGNKRNIVGLVESLGWGVHTVLPAILAQTSIST